MSEALYDHSPIRSGSALGFVGMLGLQAAERIAPTNAAARKPRDSGVALKRRRASHRGLAADDLRASRLTSTARYLGKELQKNRGAAARLRTPLPEVSGRELPYRHT